MAQERAQSAIAPFIALCKSATSPRAASDLVQQAINAPGAYTFADLLAQPNINALKTDSQYASYHTLLEIYAWGTWETYTAQSSLPKLTDPQILKLRLLSLLSYAVEKGTDLSYSTLCRRLQLDSAVDLEHLVTTAIFSDLLSATLNPARQVVQITSVAPVRDLAPGSVQTMIQELEQWSGRCDSVLAELEAEIASVKADAAKRAAEKARIEKQISLATEANEKSSASVANRAAGSHGHGGGAHRSAKNQKKDRGADEEDELYADEDAMDIDGQSGAKKKSASGFLGRFKGR